ncbi:transglutaminase-like cysteine peptidase [Aureimonas sp. OT7]|uniref:Transglutaminase n=1 Tax=Aureimonas altamirensis TaxID=370622 RepID=A0A0B1PZW4_9HYPH|nr:MULTISPECIES: transglutaminase-like cysteine peptidase [Aureimonas]KHJ54073.1 transglutaminase [Aureimonas altamirensis]QOG05778.1 transglutaminase-like cysteine peptidase [Aureimonas sp. OT7]
MAVNKFLTISTVAIGFVLGVFTAPAKADMPVTGPTSQPVGHYVFCQSYPEQCQPNRQIRLTRMDDATWRLIVEVNNTVNTAITPKTDLEMHGVPELWSYPTTEGDCEDFALLKQYMLEKAGLPRSSLLITVVQQPNGEGHAVLTVRTDAGDYVLDNLDERVLRWTDTPYRFLKRQAEANSGKWAGIADDRDMMLVGSVR